MNSVEREEEEENESTEDHAASIRFDPLLSSNHPIIVSLGAELASAYFAEQTARQRQPSQHHKETIGAVCLTLAANCARGALYGGIPLWISRQRLKRAVTRYDRQEFNAGLVKVIDAMGHPGSRYFTFQTSTQRGRASELAIAAPTAKLLGGVTTADLYCLPRPETVYLSRKQRVGSRVLKELVDYRDNAETRRLRAEMAQINTALRAANMQFIPDGGPPVLTAPRDLYRSFRIEPGDKKRFDKAGRLFGGWWMTLEKSRRQQIRLEDEPTAELDFSQLFLNLAYCEAGEVPPPGDLYKQITARFLLPDCYRAGFKRAVSAMLFASSPLTQLAPDIKAALPNGITPGEVRGMIRSVHPHVASVFESGRGLHLMFVESQIMVATLLTLIRVHGLTAILPLHDSLICPTSQRDTAEAVMSATAEKVTGRRLPIALKG